GTVVDQGFFAQQQGGAGGAFPTDGSGPDDPEKISVSQEYLHGLRVALDTERRRVEELEAEVCRLNKELATLRKPSPRLAEETSGDAPPGHSEPCSPKKRLESAVKTDRVLTNALDHMEAAGTGV
ncbi:unnamed protein product, partial [Ectocarpus sp. 6 AP-2014]